MSKEDTKKSPTIEALNEAWDLIRRSWILIRNRETGEKTIMRQGEGLKYMVGPENRKKYEVEKIFRTDDEIAVAETLYGQQKKKDEEHK